MVLQIPVFAETIDIVYTWVDGSDPVWKEKKNFYFRKSRKAAINPDSNSKNRYRNRDELKYSLRSLFKYCHFFHHIYIITDHQVPFWLASHPDITVVDHQAIFRDKSDLPTFNSIAIEANLHRIGNLAEKFIYFNDDVFLMKEVTEEDFFSKNGQIKACLSEWEAPAGDIVEGESAYISVWKNTNELLNQNFKDEKRIRLAHAPFALTKSFIEEVESEIDDVFDLVSSHRFRDSNDFALTNGLIQYWGYYNDRCKFLKSGKCYTCCIGNDSEKNMKKFKKCTEGGFTFFCLEDDLQDDDEAIDDQTQKFLEQLFPEKAPWERS